MEKVDARFKKGELSMQDWIDIWNDGAARRMPEVNPELVKREKLLLPSDSKRYRVLLPLCGNAREIKWFLDKGHSVVGVDCSEAAVKQCFTEHGIEYSSTEDGLFKVLKSADPKYDVTFYVGDIFALPQATFEKCDAVWDFGSIVVINPSERKRYIDAIWTKVTKDVNYLMVVFNFDGYEQMTSPLFHTTTEMIEEVSGHAFKVAEVENSARDHVIMGRAVATQRYYHLVTKD